MRARDTVHAVTNHLGPSATERARGLALTFGRATAPARLTPSILVVGAQRCGTTTMFRLLAEHPHVLRPTVSKGTGYFDDDYDRTQRWYQGHFPLHRPQPGRESSRPVTFECSGYYLFHPLAARRIAVDLPDVKVVALVRDPAERAASAHRHELARGFDHLDFDEAVALEGVRTAGETVRLEQQPGYRSHAHRHHAYLQRGEYAHQVRRFRDALGPDRVHVVDAGDFFADPRTEFLALQSWLGLPAWSPDEVAVHNARPGPSLDGARRRRLLRHFEPHDHELTELIGREPSWRRGVVS